MVQEDFLSGVNALVKDYSSTPWGRNVLTNYMIWRLLAAFYPDRPPEESVRRERCLKVKKKNYNFKSRNLTHIKS